jgi:hypothetical protein
MTKTGKVITIKIQANATPTGLLTEMMMPIK